MPTHEIPHLIFGVTNRVSYKSRNLKNSTLNTELSNYVGYSKLQAKFQNTNTDYPDWEITSSLTTKSATY